MKEIWKDIKGYEGLYQISNLGNVKSLEKIINDKKNRKYIKKERIMKPMINNSGYYELILKKEGKSKHYRVHRLVADAFIKNPKNFPIINHKDHNKLNNKFDNLEWCTQKYNVNYDFDRKTFPKKVKIKQYDLNMNYIKTFNSMKEIETEYEVSRTTIRFCCLGRNKTCKGFIWRYADE